ncbi:MAG: PaaI family thioesterase [Chloroflexi bacterium]|nr:PaaI family thioesterase [Chloroflexota bacterium]
MRHRVQRKQPNSKMCFVCGLKNEFGLHASFYELDNGEVLAVFTPAAIHQSYPDRVHGGIATAILDETIGRAIMIRHNEEVWGVTIEFTTRYRKPIPVATQLRAVGRITVDARRFFEGAGEILLPDGTIAAEGWGKYLKLPPGKITAFDAQEQEWRVTCLPDDPAEVDI